MDENKNIQLAKLLLSRISASLKRNDILTEMKALLSNKDPVKMKAMHSHLQQLTKQLTIVQEEKKS